MVNSPRVGSSTDELVTSMQTAYASVVDPQSYAVFVGIQGYRMAWTAISFNEALQHRCT